MSTLSNAVCARRIIILEVVTFPLEAYLPIYICCVWVQKFITGTPNHVIDKLVYSYFLGTQKQFDKNFCLMNQNNIISILMRTIFSPGIKSFTVSSKDLLLVKQFNWSTEMRSQRCNAIAKHKDILVQWSNSGEFWGWMISCCCLILTFKAVFIGPRYTWGPIYGSESHSHSTLLKY